MNVERAELLNALAATLPQGTVVYGVRCADARELADDHDLLMARLIALAGGPLLRRLARPDIAAADWRRQLGAGPTLSSANDGTAAG